MPDINRITDAYTHSGIFHADDVFATAVIKKLNSSIKIHRVFQPPENSDSVLVYDIGGGKFDHHQQDSEIRENGKPYAAFGLVWKEFAMCIPGMTETAARSIDEDLIEKLDETDNTGTPDSLAFAVSQFNPSWNSDESSDDAFEKAVAFASTVLENMINKTIAKEAASAEVQTALDKMQDNIVILERFAPWKSVLIESDAEFVIYPSQRSGYNVQAVPKEKHSTDLKIPFPHSWCEAGDDIAEISGIDGITFCHKSGFLIACRDIETAVRAVKAAKISE